MKYKFQKNPDGTYTVFTVPVFTLGQHRNFNYDTAWAQKLINNHSALQNKGYYPPVIIGHNDFRNIAEKESNGFMKNIRLENGLIFSDIHVITEEDFQKIKDLKYPYRSVEVYGEEARMSALAFLGGTEPYFLFPALQLENPDACYCIQSDHEPAEYYDITGKPVYQNTGKPEIFSRDNLKKSLDALIKFIPFMADNSADAETPHTPETLPQGDKNMKLTPEQREQFKAEHGYYPEEMAALKQQNEAYRVQIEKSTVESFKNELQTAHIAPAVIELVEKSSFRANPDFIALMRSVVKYAADGLLIIKTEDTVKNKKDGGKNYASFSVEDIENEAKELLAAGKFTEFYAAVNHVKNLVHNASRR